MTIFNSYFDITRGYNMIQCWCHLDEAAKTRRYSQQNPTRFPRAWTMIPWFGIIATWQSEIQGRCWMGNTFEKKSVHPSQIPQKSPEIPRNPSFPSAGNQGLWWLWESPCRAGDFGAEPLAERPLTGRLGMVGMTRHWRQGLSRCYRQSFFGRQKMSGEWTELEKFNIFLN